MSGADEFFPDIGRKSPSGRTSRRFFWPTPKAREPGWKVEKHQARDGTAPKPWERVYDKETGIHRTWGLEQAVKSISSRGDSPVSQSPSPASDEDRTTSGGSGPSSSGSFAYYDHDSSSWKTSQGSLLEEWETFSEGWPAAGMTRNGIAYQRRPLVPRTSVTESSLWRTPNAQEPGWRHIRVRDAHGCEPPCHPNQRFYDVDTGRVVQQGLTQQVRMWPTPRTTDSHGPGVHGDGGLDLRTAVSEQTGGQLNPRWVEWLMGFPLGWTDLEDSETPLFPKLRNGSGDD